MILVAFWCSSVVMGESACGSFFEWNAWWCGGCVTAAA